MSGALPIYQEPFKERIASPHLPIFSSSTYIHRVHRPNWMFSASTYIHMTDL